MTGVQTCALPILTYTMSPTLGSEFWDVGQLYDDPGSGYEGSHFVVYDMRTDQYASWGTPAPREMIYGGLLDKSRRRYYYHTWLRSRLGYVDLEERYFRDLGRITRRASFMMFHDRHGRIFGATRELQIWRYDPDTNRIEFLDRWLPRRKPEMDTEMFIISVNHRDDGVIVGGCRGGFPFWRYDPEDGDQGSIESLGNPWPELEDGSTDSGWIPLLGRDGFLYYWTRTTVDEDTHLIRLNIETGVREDLGLAYIEGKSLGIWVGPGAVGPDGRLYWGDSGYHKPRVVVIDPTRLAQVPSPVEAEITMPDDQVQAKGTPITVHPLNSDWSHLYVASDRVRAIPVCGDSAPYGSCAITSLACTHSGLALGVTSGRSCRLIAHDPSAQDASTVQIHDTGIAGTAYHSLVVSPDDRAFFGVDPSDGAIPAPIFRIGMSSHADNSVERICLLPEGIKTLVADWDRGRLHVLTSRTNELLRLTLDGKIVHRTGQICARQLSPTLALDSDGSVYGAERGGRIWRLAIKAGEIERLELSAPSLKGRAYLAEWQAAVAHGKWIYGSSSDGYMFRFDPRHHRLVNLGRPLLEVGLRALTITPDGSIYGAGGAPEYGIAHMFRYHPDSGFEDLGQLDSAVCPFGVAVRIACMATSADGTVYIGEDDDVSHLWVYHPLGMQER